MIGEMLQSIVKSGLKGVMIIVEESTSKMKDSKFRETACWAARRAVRA
jgi:hypothetical protein